MNLYVYVFVALVVITLIYMEYTSGVMEASPLWRYYIALLRTQHNTHNETTPPNPEHTNTSAIHRSNVTITPNTTHLTSIGVNSTGVDNSSIYLTIQMHGCLVNEMWEYERCSGLRNWLIKPKYWSRHSWIYTNCLICRCWWNVPWNASGVRRPSRNVAYITYRTP